MMVCCSVCVCVCNSLQRGSAVSVTSRHPRCGTGKQVGWLPRLQCAVWKRPSSPAFFRKKAFSAAERKHQRFVCAEEGSSMQEKAIKGL